MGRRSLHTPEELRLMILTSSREIVEVDGMKGLSARAIAKKIGYSPGTLYNVFKNLDDLLLTIQVALVEDAVRSLRAVPEGPQAQDYVRALGRRYIGFALENRRLWNLLFQHTPPGSPGRDMLNQNVASMAEIIGAAVSQLGSEQHEGNASQMGKAIWFGLHGMSAMAVSDQHADTRPEIIADYAALLVDGALALTQKRKDAAG